MEYQYACRQGHEDVVDAPMGMAPASISCQSCLRQAFRVFGAAVHGGDPFRSNWLNKDLAGREQRPIGSMLNGRFVESPKDKFEARHIERAHGIKFVGDDASALKPKAQAAIQKHQHRAKEIPR